MTDAPTIDREQTLYITDAELIRRMGVPEHKAVMSINGGPLKSHAVGSHRPGELPSEASDAICRTKRNDRIE